MKMVALFVFIVFLASGAHAAEPDPRLAQIQQQRLLANKDVSIAQLLMENAQMRLKTLDEEEQKIKAEVKAKTQPEKEKTAQ